MRNEANWRDESRGNAGSEAGKGLCERPACVPNEANLEECQVGLTPRNEANFAGGQENKPHLRSSPGCFTSFSMTIPPWVPERLETANWVRLCKRFRMDRRAGLC